jgi:hypothetical protein
MPRTKVAEALRMPSGTLLRDMVGFVRFQVLTAPSMNKIAFWNMAPCSSVKVNRHFRDAYCLHHQGIVNFTCTF